MTKGVNYILYSSVLLAPILFIFTYGNWKCQHKNVKDPLQTLLFLDVEMWGATHFLWFMLMGYLFPQTFILTMFMGILWELFEHYHGKERPRLHSHASVIFRPLGKLIGGFGDCKNLATDRADGNWWYGKWSDIACNIIGFLVGRYMKTGKLSFN